jgi:hypothetical protein
MDTTEAIHAGNLPPGVCDSVRAMRLASTCLVTLSMLVACGGDPGPATEPPAAPAENDPSFDIAGARDWYLVGNELTPGGDTFTVRFAPPDGVGYIDAWVAGRPGVRLSAQDDGFYLQAEIGDLGPGIHDVLFAADGADEAFARVEFRRSHPYYVLATTDWDFSDPQQPAMDFHDTLHAEHPHVRITHFVPPYTFTDPDVTDARPGPSGCVTTSTTSSDCISTRTATSSSTPG